MWYGGGYGGGDHCGHNSGYPPAGYQPYPAGYPPSGYDASFYQAAPPAASFLPDPGYGVSPYGYAAPPGAPPASSFAGYPPPPGAGDPAGYPVPPPAASFQGYPSASFAGGAQPPKQQQPAPAAPPQQPQQPPTGPPSSPAMQQAPPTSYPGYPPARPSLEAASSTPAAASFLFSDPSWPPPQQQQAPPPGNETALPDTGSPSSWQPSPSPWGGQASTSAGTLPGTSEVDFLERFRLIGRTSVPPSSSASFQGQPAAAASTTPASLIPPTSLYAAPPQYQAYPSFASASSSSLAPASSSTATGTPSREEDEALKKVAAAEARLADLERREKERLADLERREFEFGQKQQQFLQRQATFQEEKEREMRRIREMQVEFEQKLSTLREREEEQRHKQEAEMRILHEELAGQRDQLDQERQRLLKDAESATAARQQQQREYAAFQQAKANLDAQGQELERQRQQLAQAGQSAASVQAMQQELERRSQAMQQEAARLAHEQRRLEQEAQAERARQQEFARWQEQEMNRQMEEVRLQAELLQKHQAEEQRNVVEELRLQREQLSQQQAVLQQKETAIAAQAAQREAQIQQAIQQFQAERAKHEGELRQRETDIQQRQARLQQEAEQLKQSKNQDAQANARLQVLQKELHAQQQQIEQERAKIEAKGAELRTALDANQAQTAQARQDLVRLQAEVQGRQNVLKWEEKKNTAPPLPPRDFNAPLRVAPPLPPRDQASITAAERTAMAVRLQKSFRYWRAHRGLVKWWAVVEQLRKHEVSRDLRNRFRTTREIYTTEVSYIANMQILVNVYRAGIVSKLEHSPDSLALKKKDVATLFGPVDVILNFSMQLESQLEKALQTWPLPASSAEDSFFGILLRMAPHLKLYSAYFNNFTLAQQIMDKINKDKYTQEFLREIAAASRSSLDLPSLLIQPCQRPPRYELLLREVLKNTPQEHVEYELVRQAHAAFQATNQSINAAKAHAESMSKMVELSGQIAGMPTGKLCAPHRELRRESFGQVSATKKSHSGSFQLFLFSDGILAVTKRSEVQKAFGALSYAYAWHILFDAHKTVLNELPSVENMFRLSCGDPDSVAEFALYTFSMDDAPAWINELRQFLGGDRQSRRPVSMMSPPGLH